jgi:hypothetical protein
LNSKHTSPAFLVLKADTVVLPCWVNDYQILNVNTILDAHLLPCIDNILTDCTKGKRQTGATLSVRTSWELARPIVFDSMQLKGAERNYPVHKKEMLAIICALKKWQSDLLGIPIIVYTDHCTLENFNTQQDLSQCQLRWQEFLSHYNMTIVYIPGEDNMVADALSRVLDGAFPGETIGNMSATPSIAINHLRINMTPSITMDPSVLCTIQEGYETDEFCLKFFDFHYPVYTGRSYRQWPLVHW